MKTRLLPLLLLAAAAGTSCSQQDFVTDVPLRVVSITSSNGSAGAPHVGPDGGLTGQVDLFVPRDAQLLVTFSERLAEESLKDNVLLESLDADGNPTTVPAAVTYADAPVPTVTVNPTDTLPFSTALSLTLKTGIKRFRDKGPLPTQVRWTARTENPPALRVVSVRPAGGAEALPRSAQLQVVFSEPPDCASLAAAVVTETADPHPHTAAAAATVAGSWSCPQVDARAAATLEGTQCAKSAEKCTATFKPTDSAFLFKYSSSVSVALAGGDTASPVKSIRATGFGGALAEPVTSTFRVVDPPALQLLTTLPASGATEVSRSSTLTVSFSEPVDCETLTAAGAVTVTQKLDGHVRFGTRAGTTETVAGSWSCKSVPASAGEGPAACAASADNCRAVFTPAQSPAFEYSSVVTVTFPGGTYTAGTAPTTRDRVESLRATTRSGQLPASVSFQVLAEDPEPLAFALSVPGNGTDNVQVAPPPSVDFRFGRQIDCASVTASSVSATIKRPDNTTSSWPLTVVCMPGSDHVTLTPQSSTPLPYDSDVTFTLSGGAFSSGARKLEAADATSRGGQLSTTLTVTFHTEEPPPLALVAATPSDGTEGASPTEPLVFTFSQPVDCASISGTTVLVQQTPANLASGLAVPAASSVACAFSCPLNGDPNKVQCAHAALLPSAAITATLHGGAESGPTIRATTSTANGGHLPADVTLSFRVKDPAPLTVSGASPNGYPATSVPAETDVRFTFSRAVRCASALSHLTLARKDTGATVPATTTCTPDGLGVVLRPSAPLEVQRRYVATALAGIEAQDATVVSGSARGTLASDVAVEFDVGFEALRMLATTPAASAQAAGVGDAVSLRFNQGVKPETLVPCTRAAHANCNVFVNRGATSNAATALNVDGVAYDAATATWTMDPADPDAAVTTQLAPSQLYTVTVRKDAVGTSAQLLGQNGRSTLASDVVFSFTTSSGLVQGVTPADGAQDAAAESPVCVDFAADVDVPSLTQGGNQVTLTWVDAFGRTATVPLDPATPYLVSGSPGSGQSANRVCLALSAAAVPCAVGSWRLQPGTTYHAAVSAAVTVGGQSAPVTWQFRAALPPALSGVSVSNTLVDEPLNDGDTEVPVNSAYTVAFSEPMDAASLTEANLHLVRLDTGVKVATTVAAVASGGEVRAARLSTPVLSYGTAYALELLGGRGGISTLSGTPLGADVRLGFTTSPRTNVTFSPPPESGLAVTALVSLVTDRALSLASVTDETVYATNNSARMSGILAVQPLQPRAATFMANPTWTATAGGSKPYVLQTTTGLLDHRGNPVPAVTTAAYAASSAPAAVKPTAQPAPVLAARADMQSFTVTMPGTSLVDRMLSTSYYSTPSGADGTVWLEALGGSYPPSSGIPCPHGAGTRLALDTVLVPAANASTLQPTTSAANPDRVLARVVGPEFIQRGCMYRLHVHQSFTANLFNQGNTPELTLDVTGETTPPTATVTVLNAAGQFVAPASGVASGRVTVKATFSEPLDPGLATRPGATADSTELSSNFRVTGTLGTLPGTYSLRGNEVTWTSANLLPENTSVTVTLDTGLVDLAGNGVAFDTRSFSVESTPATLVSTAWNAPTSPATRGAPYGSVVLTFSEPVDPSTVVCSTAQAAGSVVLRSASTAQFSCAVASAADGRQVVVYPDSAYVPDAVDINKGAATLRDLAGTPVTATTLTIPSP